MRPHLTALALVWAVVCHPTSAADVRVADTPNADEQRWLRHVIPLPKEAQIKQHVTVPASEVRLALHGTAGPLEQHALRTLRSLFLDKAGVDGAAGAAYEILLGICDKAGRVGATTYHPATAWADPSLVPRTHDPARAAELLDEAGWNDRDGDGVRDRDGQPFRFSLMIANSAQKLADHLAAWKQESWSELGLDVEIERIEWQAFREKRNAGRFHAATFSLTFTTSPDQYELYHSSARETGFNFYGLADPEIDRLCEEGRRAFDPDERRAVYHRLQALLHEREPLTCLFYFSSPVLHDRRLEGVTPSPLDYWRTTRGPRLWSWAEAPDEE